MHNILGATTSRAPARAQRPGAVPWPLAAAGRLLPQSILDATRRRRRGRRRRRRSLEKKKKKQEEEGERDWELQSGKEGKFRGLICLRAILEEWIRKYLGGAAHGFLVLGEGAGRGTGEEL